MKVNAPKKIYLVPFGRPIVEPLPKEGGSDVETIWSKSPYGNKEAGNIEYVRTDAFIEKARKWFEKQNEWCDINGIKHCDMESFEDFRKYMEGE